MDTVADVSGRVVLVMNPLVIRAARGSTALFFSTGPTDRGGKGGRWSLVALMPLYPLNPLISPCVGLGH